MTKVLDCTLRDGGYYTSWDFDQKLVTSYLDAVAALPIDCVELGYISREQSATYRGEYFYLPESKLAYARDLLDCRTRIAVMVNVKECPDGAYFENILTRYKGLADIVRFACPPSDIDRGIEFSAIAASMGFETGLNVMYLTHFSENMQVLRPLAHATSSVGTVSLVDSYGGMLPDQVHSVVSHAKDMLPQAIGFHGHNNVSLALANTISAILAEADVVDATMAGMGRGAGNTPTELLLAWMWSSRGLELDFARLSRCVAPFNALRNQHDWGPSLPYAVSGLSKLPQGEVMSWLSKRRYSQETVIDALKRDRFEVAENRNYPALTSLCHPKASERSILVLGGGTSLDTYADPIKEFAQKRCDAVIHASLRSASGIRVSEQFICLAGQEIARWPKDYLSSWLQENDTLIVASPPRFINSVPAHNKIAQVEVGETFEGGNLGPISDIGPIQLALSAARDLGADQIFLAGFDGYEAINPAEKALLDDVNAAFTDFKKLYPHIALTSLLPTGYDIPVSSVFFELGSS